MSTNSYHRLTGVNDSTIHIKQLHSLNPDLICPFFPHLHRVTEHVVTPHGPLFGRPKARELVDVSPCFTVPQGVLAVEGLGPGPLGGAVCG